jgi:hypothetical protein
MMTLVTALLILVPAWSLVQQPDEASEEAEITEEGPEEISLAEFARRERARRSMMGQPDRVITNANIDQVQGLVSTSAAPPTRGGMGDESMEGEGEGEGDTAEGSEEDGESDAEQWRGIFAEAVRELENLINLGLVLELRMVDLNNSFFTATGPAKGDIQQQLQETREELRNNQGQVQSARQTLNELESDAAMDGVLPGTIREMIGALPTRDSFRNTPGR